MSEARTPVEGRTLRDLLAVVYRLGYRSTLILAGLGVVLPLFGLEDFRIAAYAGLGVLLATPLIAALTVGVVGAVRRDRHLVLTVMGIFLLLAATALLQLA